MDNFKTTAKKLIKVEKSQKTPLNKTRNTGMMNSKNKSNSKINSSHENMKNPTSLELIKTVCEDYGLTRREVFEIHSQFKAMTVPVDHGIQEGNTINDEYFEALRRNRHPERYMKENSKSNIGELHNQNSSMELPVDKIDGIKLDYFSEN